MFGPLNHVAIRVPDLAAAVRLCEKLGAEITPPKALPEHGVTVVFIRFPNTKIELLHPLGDNSPIASFQAKNPSGGIHHLCFEVPDILEARDAIIAAGIRILGDGKPKTGAHGLSVLFAHTKDLHGPLIEVEQVDS